MSVCCVCVCVHRRGELMWTYHEYVVIEVQSLTSSGIHLMIASLPRPQKMPRLLFIIAMIRCNIATEAHQRYYLQKHSTKNDAALTYLKTTAENNYLASIDVIRYSDDTVFFTFTSSTTLFLPSDVLNLISHIVIQPLVWYTGTFQCFEILVTDLKHPIHLCFCCKSLNVSCRWVNSELYLLLWK